MGEAGRVEVVHERVRQVPVAEPGPPGTGVHLVDRHRPIGPAARGALGRPVLVRPDVSGFVHHRGGGRRQLRRERDRVRLVPPDTVAAENLVLVPGPGPDARHEELPHPRGAHHPHGGPGAGPVVEVAGQAHAASIRRPYGERRPGHLAARRRIAAYVRPEHLPQFLVTTLADEVLVDLADRRQPSVGVVHLVDGVRAVVDAQPVIADLARNDSGEDAAVDVVHGDLSPAGQQCHRLRMVPERAYDGRPVALCVAAEDRVRVSRIPADHLLVVRDARLPNRVITGVRLGVGGAAACGGSAPVGGGGGAAARVGTAAARVRGAVRRDGHDGRSVRSARHSASDGVAGSAGLGQLPDSARGDPGVGIRRRMGWQGQPGSVNSRIAASGICSHPGRCRCS